LRLELHPWNVDFTWVNHTGPGYFLSEKQRQQFDADGFFIVPQLLSVQQTIRIREAIDEIDIEFTAWLSEHGDDGMNQQGAMSFMPHLTTRSAVLRDAVRHPSLLDVVADLLGPDIDLYWDQAVYKRPERPQRFPLHQDTGYQFTQPQDFLSVWIALSDATPENGCLYLVPGIHRHGTLRHHHVEPQGWEECLVGSDPPLVAAPVAAGGAVVFSSLTPHTTGANISDGIRKAYLVLYSRPGLAVYPGSPVGPWAEQEPAEDTGQHVPLLRDRRLVR
jgi:phytanoyl-CoA hydroxylase